MPRLQLAPRVRSSVPSQRLGASFAQSDVHLRSIWGSRTRLDAGIRVVLGEAVSVFIGVTELV
jgi:hypothetical protein